MSCRESVGLGRLALLAEGEADRCRRWAASPGGDGMSTDSDFCTVRIAPSVLATIAGLTAMEVPGVLRTSGGLVSGVSKLVGREDPTRGVRLRVKDDQVYLDIHVVVEQGADLVRVGNQIQRDVARAIDKMVGLQVAEINVYVQDLE